MEDIRNHFLYQCSESMTFHSKHFANDSPSLQRCPLCKSESSFDFSNLFVNSTLVHTERSSGTKILITEIAWNRYSFQVICLDMMPYISAMSLLSTDFANESFVLFWYPTCLCSSWNHILASLHQRLHFLLQCLQIPTNLLWNGCMCSRNNARHIYCEAY